MAGRRGLRISFRIADNVMGRKYNLSREEMRDYLLTKVQIDPVTGCWNWVGKKNTTSSAYRYGVLRFHSRQYMATAISFWAFNDDQEEIITGHGGDSIYHCHKCDNTLCINPDHIFLGTQEDNCRDSAKKRRHWAHSRTACKYGHPFDEKNTFLRDGHYRVCIACQRQRQRTRMGVTPDRYRV